MNTLFPGTPYTLFVDTSTILAQVSGKLVGTYPSPQTARLDIPIPKDPSLCGVKAYFQCGYWWDANGRTFFALSNGLEWTVGT